MVLFASHYSLILGHDLGRNDVILHLKWIPGLSTHTSPQAGGPVGKKESLQLCFLFDRILNMNFRGTRCSPRAYCRPGQPELDSTETSTKAPSQGPHS